MLVGHLCLIMINQWVWKQATTDWLTESSYLFVLFNDESPSLTVEDPKWWERKILIGDLKSGPVSVLSISMFIVELGSHIACFI